MAYSAPELLLVGAAQNLVLGGSSNKHDVDCNENEQEDGFPSYDINGLW